MEKIEVLSDGTPITDKVVNDMVADVYQALEKGAFKVIPNPHKNETPIKVTDPHILHKLEEAGIV